MADDYTPPEPFTYIPPSQKIFPQSEFFPVTSRAVFTPSTSIPTLNPDITKQTTTGHISLASSTH